MFPGQSRDDGEVVVPESRSVIPIRRPGKCAAFIRELVNLPIVVPESRSVYPGSYEHQEVVVFRARPFRLGPGASPG